MNVSINHTNALGMTSSPPIRSGKISAVWPVTHSIVDSARNQKESVVEARVTARPVDNIS
jgi:hypothetical protein